MSSALGNAGGLSYVCMSMVNYDTAVCIYVHSLIWRWLFDICCVSGVKGDAHTDGADEGRGMGFAGVCTRVAAL